MSTIKVNRIEPYTGNTITAIGLTVESASYAGNANTATTAVTATTASYVSGSILNYPDADGTTPTIMRMVSMTSASYAALTPKDANTFYVII